MTARLRPLCVLLAVLTVFLTASAAVPGAGDDPVVSLSYINKTYLPDISARTKAKTSDYMKANLTDASGLLKEVQALSVPGGIKDMARTLAGAVASRLTKFAPHDRLETLKNGAVIEGGLGTTFTVLSGSAVHTGPVLIDVTTGKDLTSGGAPAARHKLMCSAGKAGLRVTSDSAVIMVSGYYRITAAYSPKYADICKALITMGVVGDYDLDRVSRRQEMFIVFLTILGEKAQAEAYGTKHPFNDVAWGHNFVAYLYDKSYTAGTGGAAFSPNMAGSVQQMCFLFLKALGYTDRVDMKYETAVDDAVRLGLFTKNEVAMLSVGEFRRDQMMYMCYYALHARYKNSADTVLDRLIRSGFTTRAAADTAVASVTRTRP